MSDKIKSKYNRSGSGANKSVFEQLSGDTGVQEPVNKGTVKKKATFEIDADLHKRLRIYATTNDTTMVDVLEKALTDYMDKHQ